MTQEKDAKEDRRVQRTRQLLRDALVAEILAKGYEAMTVQDILDRANLGRSTFYAHYRDKEDLLLSSFEDFRAAFETPMRLKHGGEHGGMEGAFGEGADFSLALFRHVAQFRAAGKAMLGKQSGNIVLNHLRAHLTTHLRDRLGRSRDVGDKHNVPLEIIIEFLVSSLLGLLIWWIDQDFPNTPEQMDALFKQLALPGVSAALAMKMGG